MLLKVASIWEQHSALRRLPCEKCGDEIYIEAAHISEPGASERLSGKCGGCGHARIIDFDISGIDANAYPALMARAWPPPAGPPYPLAEQKLPKVVDEALTTKKIADRWAIIGGRTGSMGRAFLCADTHANGALVIVKLPREPDDHDALRREIGVYMQLCWEGGRRSAHVLELLNVVPTKLTTPWLVVEVVLPGPNGAVTVDDWLREGLITTEIAHTWLSHLANAMLHCAALIDGFVHGDLKPDNLLVDEGPTLKLFDFGMSGDGAHAATVGAPAYRAPELWSNVTPTTMSDVYAYGCIGYELLTGSPPFRAREFDPDALRYAHCYGRPETDERVPQLILSCLEKQPDARPRFNPYRAYKISLGESWEGFLANVVKQFEAHHCTASRDA